MFEQWAGPEAFRRGVLAYLEAHAWGNATADDLWRELDRASGKNLSDAMAGFIEQPGVPLVEVTSVAGSRVTLAQHRFHVLGVEQAEETWRIPVGLKYGGEKGIKTETVLLDAPEKTFDLGSGVEWVMPNAEALLPVGNPAEALGCPHDSRTPALSPGADRPGLRHRRPHDHPASWAAATPAHSQRAGRGSRASWSAPSSTRSRGSSGR
jgi:hypothetical protein